MQGAGICLGVHRDRPDTHLLQGTNDAAGDRAAIGYQDFIEHISPESQVVLRVSHASGRPDALVNPKPDEPEPKLSSSSCRSQLAGENPSVYHSAHSRLKPLLHWVSGLVD
jgi:hypothetical protein